MNDIEVLEYLCKFLKENVASKIKLERPPDRGKVEEDYELVNPAVHEGWVPPKNFSDYGYDVPGIIVMIDDGSEDTLAELSVRLKIITYDPGTTQEDGELSPNTKGYKDLLNVITRIRMELSQNPIILEKVNVNKPIKWSMDEEQSYPYWSANISFGVSIAPLLLNINEQYL